MVRQRGEQQRLRFVGEGRVTRNLTLRGYRLAADLTQIGQ